MPSIISWTSNRLAWLTLVWFDGFGSKTLGALRRRYESDGQAALQVSADELEALGHRSKTIARFFEYRNTTNPSDLASRVDEEGINVIFPEDPMYPPLLAQISDPPAALFWRGEPLDLQREYIAVVGTRGMTPYGKTVIASLCTDLVASGFGIVSGLAFGVDAAAHEAALNAQGRTLAVLGSGVDEETIYPREHTGLAKRILEHGGGILSEFPPGTEALKHHFPLRNRIISGLCRATIIVEAAAKSGSLVTAHLALEQNREVFAVPGPITSTQSFGTNSLLRQGAIPCTGIQDILEALRGSAPIPRIPPQTLTIEEQQIMELLEYPRHLDELVRASKHDVATLSGQLMTLQLKGCVETQGRNLFVRSRLWRQDS